MVGDILFLEKTWKKIRQQTYQYKRYYKQNFPRGPKLDIADQFQHISIGEKINFAKSLRVGIMEAFLHF